MKNFDRLEKGNKLKLPLAKKLSISEENDKILSLKGCEAPHSNNSILISIPSTLPSTVITNISDALVRDGCTIFPTPKAFSHNVTTIAAITPTNPLHFTESLLSTKENTFTPAIATSDFYNTSPLPIKQKQNQRYTYNIISKQHTDFAFIRTSFGTIYGISILRPNIARVSCNLSPKTLIHRLHHLVAALRLRGKNCPATAVVAGQGDLFFLEPQQSREIDHTDLVRAGVVGVVTGLDPMLHSQDAIFKALAAMGLDPNSTVIPPAWVFDADGNAGVIAAVDKTATEYVDHLLIDDCRISLNKNVARFKEKGPLVRPELSDTPLKHVESLRTNAASMQPAALDLYQSLLPPDPEPDPDPIEIEDDDNFDDDHKHSTESSSPSSAKSPNTDTQELPANSEGEAHTTTSTSKLYNSTDTETADDDSESEQTTTTSTKNSSKHSKILKSAGVASSSDRSSWQKDSDRSKNLRSSTRKKTVESKSSQEEKTRKRDKNRKNSDSTSTHTARDDDEEEEWQEASSSHKRANQKKKKKKKRGKR